MNKQEIQKKGYTKVYAHYKMYKAGKRWIYASLTALSLGLSLAMIPDQVHAAVATPETTTEQKISETPAPEVSTPETPTMPKQSSLEVPASETSESEVPAPSEVPKSETSETEDIIESPKKTEVPDEGPVTDAKTPAPETGTVKSDAPTEAEPAQTTGTLSETYDDAKTQTDQANTSAETANAHLAELQALLADPDLTQTEGWQDKLQAQLAQFQDAAAAFGATKAQTDATVADYQAAIDAVIADKPNAVATVTQGSETTGQTMTDYDGLVTDYQQQVTTALEKIATQVKNYTQVDTINAAQATLQTAAETLNAQLKAVGPGDDLTMLQDAKAAYDTALSAYNTAVSTYDDQQVIHQNAADETDETKNPADTSFDKLVDYLNTKTAYDAAHQAYQTTVEAVKTANTDLTNWQQAVSEYNTILSSWQAAQNTALEQLTSVDGTDIDAAKASILATSTELDMAQKHYEAMKQSYQEATDSEKAAAAELVEAAGNELYAVGETLKTQVETWHTAYEAYLTATQNLNDHASVPLPETLADQQQKVLDSQNKLTESMAAVQTSQTEYQKTLDAYQEVLDAQETDLEAVDGSSEVISDTLQTTILTQFEENKDMMATVSPLADFKKAEFNLKQRITQIQSLTAGIENTQATFNSVSKISDIYKLWPILSDKLATLNEGMLTTKDLYAQAVEGTVATPSYATLIQNYETMRQTYQNLQSGVLGTSDYTEADIVEKQLTDFSKNLADFQENFDEFSVQIKDLVPNEETNQVAKSSLDDPDKLSTDGSSASIKTDGSATTPTVLIYKGASLENFLAGKADVDDDGNATGDLNYEEPFDLDLDTLRLKKGDLVLDDTGKYYKMSPEAQIKQATALRMGLVSTFVNDGTTYRLTAVILRGTGTDSQEIPPKALSDFYVFETTDPITEFYSIYKGFSNDLQTNQSFKFYYVALPAEPTTTITSEDGQTQKIPGLVMPTIATSVKDLSIQHPTAQLSAFKTGLPTVPAPNAVAVPEMTSYLGGTPLTAELTLDQIDQAPLLTLNKVAQPTPPTDPDEPVDPSTDPVTPMIPVGPINPEQPTDETGGTDPADPEQPTDETDETDPTDPEQPTDETGDTDSAEPNPETPGTSSDGENETTLTPETNANVESENHNDTDKATAQSTTEYAQNPNAGTVIGGMSAINGATRTATSKAMTIKNNMTTRVGAASTAKTLPQTGERHEQQRLQLIGTALLTLVTVFGGWLTTKKRKV